MSPLLILTCVGLYTLLLFGVTWMTSRGANNESFFVGNRSSRWYIVAYGMIGASLSGVTFMSVPGDVGAKDFSYFQMVLGYILGYSVIALVLLPLYYRLNLTSIYSYLQKRFGNHSYKTGAFFFIVSRIIGASFRLYIVVEVLQAFVFKPWGIPFWVTSLIFIVLILLYTYEGGVKTIVWTDTLQTTFMLISLALSVIFIAHEFHFSFGELTHHIFSNPKSKIISTDVSSPSFFPKSFFGGMFIAIAMTGLDQEMMQKNISCRSLRDAQKNVFSFTAILVAVNFVFLALGVLLYEYAAKNGITVDRSDNLFPEIALHHLGTVSGIFFVLGLISAAYPSADGALTALTASFCIDFLGFNDENKNRSEQQRKKIRYAVHAAFALIVLLVIVIFDAIHGESVLRQLFSVANYTYGPLLGLFAFGVLTRRSTREIFVPFIAVASPVICFFLNYYSDKIFGEYKFGNEMLILNGTLTFFLLWVFSVKKESNIL